MNELPVNNFKRIFIPGFYLCLTLLGAYVTIRLFYLLAPFIIAIVISSLIEPLIRFIMLKTGISRKAASLYSILLIILLSGFIIFFIISNLISEASDIYNALPEYYKRINSNLSVISDRLKDLNLALPQEVSVDAEKLITNISSSYIKILNSIIKVILNIAKAIPQTIIFILATILSTYFLSSDREKLLDALHRVIPQSLSVKIRNLKTDLFSALIGYLKAQLILLSITFTELLTGFILIGIKSPILLALIISFIDALPILGTGIILIPWSLYYLVTGDIRLAVSVVLIYLIVFIVRQLVEPRVISRQIGVHPIFTLFGMYIGFNLFGVTGLILGPVTVLTIKSTFVRMLKRTG